VPHTGRDLVGVRKAFLAAAVALGVPYGARSRPGASGRPETWAAVGRRAVSVEQSLR
jgi:hypothetical protein